MLYTTRLLCQPASMPRAPRIVVPPIANLPPQEPDGPDYDELTEIELSQLKLGDLGLLSNPEYRDWDWHIYRFRTRAEIAADPQGGTRELMGKRSGPIDLFEIQEQFGGGVFEFWGFFDKGEGEGKKLYKKPVIPIAGVRKRFDVPILQTPAPAQPISSDPLIRLLERMDQRLERMDRPAPAPAQTSIKELAETLVLLNGLHRPAGAPRNPDREVVNGLMEMVKTGIEIGQGREPATPGEGATDWGKVIEAAAPVVDRILARMTPVRRPPLRPPGAAAPAPASSSSAEVVDPESEAVVNHRWPAAIESLANAIADGEDAQEFAITLEHILNKQEFGMLRAATLDQVMTEMQAAFGAFPILKTDQAQTYIQALLAEIKNPSAPSDGQ